MYAETSTQDSSNYNAASNTTDAYAPETQSSADDIAPFECPFKELGFYDLLDVVEDEDEGEDLSADELPVTSFYHVEESESADEVALNMPRESTFV